MKKAVAILTVALMILGAMPSALAARPVCKVYGCTKTKNHAHSGKTYSAHHPEDGHYYHQCGLAGCTNAGPHNHNDYYDGTNSGSYQADHHSNSGSRSGHGFGHGRGGHH